MFCVALAFLTSFWNRLLRSWQFIVCIFLCSVYRVSNTRCSLHPTCHVCLSVVQDLDDALHIEPIEGKPGRWRVGVHIADVSHFIPPFRSVPDQSIHFCGGGLQQRVCQVSQQGIWTRFDM
jgi:hypothetical protein